MEDTSNIVNFYLDYNKLKQNYDSFNKIGQIFYPLKTNSNSEVIKELNKLYDGSDNGFLITHKCHYDKLKQIGISADKICVSNILMNDNDIRYLYNQGVRYFTFDNNYSLKEFLQYINTDEIRIAIRLNIIEVFNVFSHLGALTKDCKEMFDLLKEYKVKNFGISFYLQKETIPEGNVLNRMLNYIKNNFNTYSMSFINIGGAIKPEEIDVNKLNELKEKLNANRIIIELGRYLVGNAGYMETEIIKKTFENTFIIKNGIYSGLLDCLLYNRKFEMYLKDNYELIKLEYKPFEESKEVIFCGASSDSGDRIGKLYIGADNYNKLKIGSIIKIENALAYVEEFFMPLGGDFRIKYNILK